CHQHDNSPLSF
nr:immunoglobulin light chain junction region [Macaca mulatta]MOX86443.1 immunoglobulin light chain junction region [Macaca mulatta]MOX86766.1 immunoglobulin light chain junction region [Macaca mulatta]MOX86867.1 immunoglobulin light chain junction region [Macaca mulatta]MOX86930.1 immunoglobulin light chain junction region [Macaca mulatta]